MATLIASKPADLQIPKLTASNYKVWSELTTEALKGRAVWEYARGEVARPEEKDQLQIWVQNNAIASGIIKGAYLEGIDLFQNQGCQGLALKRLGGKARQVGPDDKAGLLVAIEHAENLGDCVLWLDDLEHYLGSGGLTRAALARFFRPGHHRVILSDLEKMLGEVRG